ncbi:ferrochelatase [Trueperella bialowiezensis]|uniref:Coproporphyrin III ferrochelatase n=1 Tax=Trueperella bialowiezensis TaxID=312285 RepID=A0A3S4VGB7_9ACTO|nr:ferrochelatase [Trueperella bialowiezensis]VEI13512.1 Ferrochelatase [Trueperella bialowiezensis]
MHGHTQTPTRGLLIVNLGSPDSTDPEDVRTFLRDFLSDTKVIDFPPFLWQPILRGIVLRVRPAKSAELYRQIWMDEGSPLVVYTKRQQEMLAEALPEWNVKYAMTYTEPSIAESLDEMAAEGVTDVTVVPLYPQWAPSSSGAIADQVHDYFRKNPDKLQWRIVKAWPTEKAFINWHADTIERALAAQPESERAQLVVCSYHGVPERKVHRPAGYRTECEASTAAIGAALCERGIDVPVISTFQSKFGPGKWLTPATIDTMASLPDKGVTSVMLATPSFVADCIETLEELDIQNQDAFKEAGGVRYARIPPINDDPAFVDVIKKLIA